MYPNPQENEATHVHEFVHSKQQAFQRVFELVGRNLTEKQIGRLLSTLQWSTTQHTKKDKKFCSIIQPSLLEQRLNLQALGRDRVSLKNV